MHTEYDWSAFDQVWREMFPHHRSVFRTPSAVRYSAMDDWRERADAAGIITTQPRTDTAPQMEAMKEKP